ncbi:MAG: hypothetical protein WEA99_03505 [Brumimicrobium sp.]
MKGFYKILLIVAFSSVLGLLIWNVYLINQVDRLSKIEKDLNFKIQILEGDLDLISYDLVTSRDSVRILNKKIKEDCPQNEDN